MQNQLKPFSRTLAFLWVIIAYLVAGVVFFSLSDRFFSLGWHPLSAIFTADIAATIAIFIFSYFFKNTSFYDPYWSLIPIFMLPILMLRGFTEGGLDEVRYLVLSSLVLFWGLRLTWNWARGWRGLQHIDWRYVEIEKKTGKWFWLVSLLGLQIMPTVLVFLGCLPLYVALVEAENTWNWLDLVAAFWTFGAILVELIADNQLRKFVKSKPPKGATLATGLWKYTRHPNYFGEVSFWFGLFLFGLAANPKGWWTIIGFLCIVALFHFISIPMIEKRHVERRSNYPEIIQKIPRWMPWIK